MILPLWEALSVSRKESTLRGTPIEAKDSWKQFSYRDSNQIEFTSSDQDKQEFLKAVSLLQPLAKPAELWWDVQNIVKQFVPL